MSRWWRGWRGAAALAALRDGVTLKERAGRGPRRSRRVAAPGWLWPRDPPVRFRKSVPEAWLRLTITEGPQPAGAAHVRPCGLARS